MHFGNAMTARERVMLVLMANLFDDSFFFTAVAISPLFGVVVAHLFTAYERLSASHLAGVLIGFLGVIARS